MLLFCVLLGEVVKEEMEVFALPVLDLVPEGEARAGEAIGFVDGQRISPRIFYPPPFPAEDGGFSRFGLILERIMRGREGSLVAPSLPPGKNPVETAGDGFAAGSGRGIDIIGAGGERIEFEDGAATQVRIDIRVAALED